MIEGNFYAVLFIYIGIQRDLIIQYKGKTSTGIHVLYVAANPDTNTTEFEYLVPDSDLISYEVEDIDPTYMYDWKETKQPK